MAATYSRPRGGKPDKLIRDALILALNREAQDEHGRKTKRLHIIADQLVRLACEGDMEAIKEIADRVDGRPVAQSPERGEGGHLTISWLSNNEEPETVIDSVPLALLK